MSLGAVQKTEISSTGRITRVMPKFAYATSNNYGCVFIPPSAALPSECDEPDLRLFYKTGDIVHFVAIAQIGKNDCSWVATKVTTSTNNDQYQNVAISATMIDGSPVIIDLLCVVKIVTETFAYLWSDEYGEIFLPGGAYEIEPGQPARLTACLDTGDIMLVNARPQSKKNGCTWLALKAQKFYPEHEVMPECKPSRANEMAPVQGFAHVQMVGPTAVVALCEKYGLVYCPVLTWTGGERNVPGADNLEQVVFLGDLIHYMAVYRQTPASAEWQCELRASRWGPDNIPKIIRKTVRNSTSQTFISADQMVVRGLKKDHPELYEKLKEKMPDLISYAEQND